MSPDFDAYLEHWRLVPDGVPITTHSSRLLPVRRDTEALMLKVALADEEIAGAEVMAWWDGDGAARVLGRAGTALLLERAEDNDSLAEMARSGRDDEATRILCGVAARLHRPREHAPPSLVPLSRWFRALVPAGAHHGPLFARAAAVASELLDSPRDEVALHGDLHHGNVLDFGARGWLAIDPKGLFGERAYDFANILYNPDAELATSRERFARQVTVIANAAGLERRRLLMWIFAYGALSVAWALEDGGDAHSDITTVEIAAAELSR